MSLKLLFFLFLTHTFAQKEINNWVFTDAFGYEYSIKNNTLFKEKEGEKYEYKNLNLGSISAIDAKNSFQSVVVYKDFHTVILLDNFLNEIKKIDFLNDFQGFMIEYVATAAGNKLWVKEKNTNFFYLLDLKTNLLLPLNRPLEDTIIGIYSDFNYLYFTTKDFKVNRISIFGNIENVLQLDKPISEFRVTTDKIIYHYENQIFENHWNEKKEKLIYTSTYKIENIGISLNKLFIFANNKKAEIDLK